jgi:proton-dependent oligopeptide transporter, POT family
VSTVEATPPKVGKLPPQIPYIIGNEACERFSFYGMRNILTQFLVSSTILAAIADEAQRKAEAKEIFHVFVMGVYFFPLLGGWLSDRYLGKYKTIFWLSLVYCAGNGFLALFTDSTVGFYTGLFLISLGSGGIKPCVSAFVGEQFDQSNKHLAKLVFDAFYWIINFGSFFASLLIPLALQSWGPRWAFGIPGILMFVATLIFWLGRNRYIVEPPRSADPHSFSRVVWTSLTSTEGDGGRPGLYLFVVGVAGALTCLVLIPLTEVLTVVSGICLALVVLATFAGVGAWLHIERARAAHPDEDVDGAKAVLRVLIIFALVTPFWSLFDQKASTWVLQGQAMSLPEWSWFKSASQMQSLNPLLVMLLIPLNNVALFPLLKALGVEVTPLRRMTAGIAFAGLSWIVIGLVQLQIDGGAKLSIAWQVLPYALLTFGEVLVSATGLEFAYSQAPMKLKGVLMSFWQLSVTVGGLWVILVNSSVKSASFTAWIESSSGIGVIAFQMFFFAAFAFAAAAAFGVYALRYKLVDYYRKA